MQNLDGSAPVADITRLKNLSKFVNKRRFNYGKKMISQVGIFYSLETRYQKGMCYNQRQSTKALQGAMNAIIDLGYTVDMILEYKLDEISKYRMVVVPEWELMSDAVKEKLKKYAKDGGKLLIIGKELTSQMTGANMSETEKYIKDKTGAFIKAGNVALLEGGSSSLYERADLRYETENAGFKTDEIGSGSITYIPFDLGSLYAKGSYYMLRNFLDDVVKTLIDKKVTVNKKNIDVSLISDGDGVILNLLNQNKNNLGMGEISVYDEVPEVYNVEIRVNGKFSSVTPLLDEAESIEIFEDYAIIKLHKLHIHTAFKLIK